MKSSKEMVYKEELTIFKTYKKIIATCMLITPDFIGRASQSESSVTLIIIIITLNTL